MKEVADWKLWLVEINKVHWLLTITGIITVKSTLLANSNSFVLNYCIIVIHFDNNFIGIFKASTTQVQLLTVSSFSRQHPPQILKKNS